MPVTGAGSGQIQVAAADLGVLAMSLGRQAQTVVQVAGAGSAGASGNPQLDGALFAFDSRFGSAVTALSATMQALGTSVQDAAGSYVATDSAVGSGFATE